MKKQSFISITILLLLMLFQTVEAIEHTSCATELTDTLRPKYTMGEFIGTNSFIDTPIDRLDPVGWIREYHPWSFTENENDQFEYNLWNGFWDFDQFYTDLKEQGIMVCPVLWSSPSWLQPNRDDRPVVDSEDPYVPYSYREIAELMYQFAGRYGAVQIEDSTIILKDGQIKKSGLGLIKYYEDWNEQNKYWAGENAQFTAGHYAAMASANADGHCGTMGPLYGLKQADPDAIFVMGGLAGMDTDYLNDMRIWFINNRPDSAWPIDVINVHHYSFRQNETGICPEKDFFKEKITQVVNWRNEFIPDNEIWLTEFGYDSNPYSMNRAPEIGHFNQEEVQAIWNLRTFLIISSTGVDRAAHFMIRDSNPENTEHRFADCGLTTSKEEGHERKVSWYYLHTMRSLLDKLCFSEVIVQDPDVWIYKYDNPTGDTAVYACWSPTYTDQTKIITFKTDIPTDSVRIITLKDQSIEGLSSIFKYDTAGIELEIGESPIFIEITEDSVVYSPDTTNISDAVFNTFPGLEIFPNPASSELGIRYQRAINSSDEVVLDLYNSSGRLLETYNDIFPELTTRITIPVNHLPSGVYLLHLYGTNMSISRSLIIDGH